MVKEWQLNNNIQCVTYQVPYMADEACVSLVVSVGSLYDGTKKGIAHYLEHMLIMSVDNSINISEDLSIRGYTDFDYTIYQIKCPNNICSIRRSISILHNILSGEHLELKDMERARVAILEEYHVFQAKKDLVSLMKILTEEENLFSSLPIGDLNIISTICFKSIVNYHLKWYRKESVGVSVVSTLGHNQIENLISDEFRTTEKLMHASFNSTGMTPSSLTSRWLFPRDGKELNIYIKNTSSLANNMKSRVIEDLGFIICENYMEEYFRDQWEMKVDVNVVKFRYSKQCRFYCIKIKGTTDEFDTWLKGQKDNAVFQLYEYTIKNFHQEEFNLYKTYYAENIMLAKEPSIFKLSEDITNYFIFNDPIYEKKEYVNTVGLIQYEQITEILRKWLIL